MILPPMITAARRRDFRARIWPGIWRWCDRVGEIAKEKGCTPSQLALAWDLAQGDDIVPIPGTKRRKYLEENIAAVDVQLTPADLSRIEDLMPRGSASGPRYPETVMRLIDE